MVKNAPVALLQYRPRLHPQAAYGEQLPKAKLLYQTIVASYGTKA